MTFGNNFFEFSQKCPSFSKQLSHFQSQYTSFSKPIHISKAYSFSKPVHIFNISRQANKRNPRLAGGVNSDTLGALRAGVLGHHLKKKVLFLVLDQELGEHLGLVKNDVNGGLRNAIDSRVCAIAINCDQFFSSAWHNCRWC